MKTHLLIAALMSVLAITAQAQKRVLIDFRADHFTKPAKIPIATQKLILSKVFRKYLTDSNKCNSQFEAGTGEDFLDSARKAGQIAPSITDVIQGSFTAAEQTQTAYIISVSECFASHADNFGSQRIAIFNGPTLVADLDLDSKGNVLRKTDLDGDGINELLMSSGYMNQGILTESAALLGFKGGSVAVIQDFGEVSEDSCASGLPDSAATASVISTVTELVKMPRFEVDRYKSSCRKPHRWKLASTGK